MGSDHRELIGLTTKPIVLQSVLWLGDLRRRTIGPLNAGMMGTTEPIVSELRRDPLLDLDRSLPLRQTGPSCRAILFGRISTRNSRFALRVEEVQPARLHVQADLVTGANRRLRGNSCHGDRRRPDSRLQQDL